MHDMVVNEVIEDTWDYDRLSLYMREMSEKANWKWIGSKMLTREFEKKSDWLSEKPIILCDGTNVYLWRWWSTADIDRFIKALTTSGKEIDCIKNGE